MTKHLYLIDRVEEILEDVEAPPYQLHAVEKKGGFVFLYANLWRPDVETGVHGWGQGSPQVITEDMSDDSIVKRCFVAARDYGEHEIREGFTYKGRRVLGPHVPLDKLWKVLDD